MFDKLIESNSAEAEFKPRRKFFMMSSVVVGILFLSALVVSLYAADIDLGTDNFELVEILAPIETDVPKPEPPRQQQQQKNETEQSKLPVRHEAIATLEQSRDIPDKISTTPFTGRTLPTGPVVINPLGVESNGVSTGPVGNVKGGNSSGDGTVAEAANLPEPPPVAVKTEPRKSKTISDGVVNGKATYLPNPPFPAPAKLIGAYGIVNVQVTIDEDGKVISSKAVSGHPLLRGTAESAAWKARFSPTLLSRVPVKVTGVIVFNFKKA